MARRYYSNSPLAPGPRDLTGPEAHHLSAVMRAQPGDSILLFDGSSGEYPATVESCGKRYVTVVVGDRTEPGRELPFALTVAAAVPKGDRGDFLVEKMVELGVTRFVPLLTERSVVVPKRDKLERAVVEASKQCGRLRLMAVDPPTPWAAVVRDATLPARRFVAHVGGEPGKWELGDVAFAVGPEGGFTDGEVAAAVAAGWGVIGLGPRVLRVETAALVLAAWAGR